MEIVWCFNTIMQDHIQVFGHSSKIVVVWSEYANTSTEHPRFCTTRLRFISLSAKTLWMVERLRLKTSSNSTMTNFWQRKIGNFTNAVFWNCLRDGGRSLTIRQWDQSLLINVVTYIKSKYWKGQGIYIYISRAHHQIR